MIEMIVLPIIGQEMGGLNVLRMTDLRTDDPRVLRMSDRGMDALSVRRTIDQGIPVVMNDLPLIGREITVGTSDHGPVVGDSTGTTGGIPRSGVMTVRLGRTLVRVAMGGVIGGHLHRDDARMGMRRARGDSPGRKETARWRISVR
jgi:hypothetical protein